MLYKSFRSPIVPYGRSVASGIATERFRRRGKRAGLLVCRCSSRLAWRHGPGIPMDLFEALPWVGSLIALGAFGLGALVVGLMSDNAFHLSIFGQEFTAFENMFGSDFFLCGQYHVQLYGTWIDGRCGVISLVQCGKMLFQKDDGKTSAAGKIWNFDQRHEKCVGEGLYRLSGHRAGSGFFTTGLYYEMSIPMLILWIVFAAIAALVSS